MHVSLIYTYDSIQKTQKYFLKVFMLIFSYICAYNFNCKVFISEKIIPRPFRFESHRNLPWKDKKHYHFNANKN